MRLAPPDRALAETTTSVTRTVVGPGGPVGAQDPPLGAMFAFIRKMFAGS